MIHRVAIDIGGCPISVMHVCDGAMIVEVGPNSMLGQVLLNVGWQLHEICRALNWHVGRWASASAARAPFTTVVRWLLRLWNVKSHGGVVTRAEPLEILGVLNGDVCILHYDEEDVLDE